MSVIGVDQSLTCSGVSAICDDGTIKYTAIRTHSKMRWLDRMNKIVSGVQVFMKEVPNIECITLEDYAYGGSDKGFVLGELGGVLKYALGSLGIPVYQISIPHPKMYVAKDGHASKTDVIKALRSQFSFSTKNDNIADAVAIGLTVKHMLDSESGKRKANAYQKMIFAKVRLYFDAQDRNPSALAKRARAKEDRRKSKRRLSRERRELLTGSGPETPKRGDYPDPFEVL